MKSYDLDTKEGMANAVTWTKSTMNCLKDGGTWILPRSLTIVTAYPSKQAVHIKDGVEPEECLRRVFRAMGWTILTNKEDVNNAPD
jgi:hypothetical protein